jgi:hypothetical protein
MSNPAGIDVPGPPQTLHYENVGILSQGFLRVTATDVDGQVVADSHPDQPLPLHSVPGDPRLLNVATEVAAPR